MQARRLRGGRLRREIQRDRLRHARTCCGHPRLYPCKSKTWMAGIKPAMTKTGRPSFFSPYAAAFLPERRPKGNQGNRGKGRTMTSLRLLVALCATVVWAESCYADCSSLHALAQQHANDMARRNSLDHAGFMARRGPAGAVAENVAMGCETEACARRMWMQSPPHRANMMLGGCQAVASAVSASGHRYWAMEIGGNSRAGTRRTGVTLTRAARRGSGDGGVVGRDFSVDGSNAP